MSAHVDRELSIFIESASGDKLVSWQVLCDGMLDWGFEYDIRDAQSAVELALKEMGVEL